MDKLIILPFVLSLFFAGTGNGAIQQNKIASYSAPKSAISSQKVEIVPIANAFVGGGQNGSGDVTGEFQPIAPDRPADFIDNGKAPELKPIDIVAK